MKKIKQTDDEDVSGMVDPKNKLNSIKESKGLQDNFLNSVDNRLWFNISYYLELGY